MQLQDHRELDTATVSVKYSHRGRWSTKKNNNREEMSQETPGTLTEIWIPVLSACISIPVAGYPKD